MLKIKTFSPIFPLADAMMGQFIGYSLGISRRLYHRKWLMLFSLKFRRNKRRLCHSIWLFYFSRMLKIETFSPIFPLADAVMGALYWLFLGNFKK